MALAEQALLERARRTYELGRLRRTVRDTWAIAPIIAVSALHHSKLPITVAVGATLFALATVLVWRGQTWGRALWPGFLAGAVPLVLPGLVPANLDCCIGGSCWSVCMLLCSASGLIAGLTIGALAAKQDVGRLQFVAASALIAGLTGSLGCVVAGLAGIVGMTAGGLVGLAPMYLRLQIRRA